MIFSLYSHIKLTASGREYSTGKSVLDDAKTNIGRSGNLTNKANKQDSTPTASSALLRGAIIGIPTVDARNNSEHFTAFPEDVVTQRRPFGGALVRGPATLRCYRLCPCQSRRANPSQQPLAKPACVGSPLKVPTVTVSTLR